MGRTKPAEFWEEYKAQKPRLGQTKATYSTLKPWKDHAIGAAIETLKVLAVHAGPAPASDENEDSLTSKWQKEYLRLDLIGYDSIGPHDWLLRVAFEHENSEEWTDELCTLCHIMADLC